MDWITATPPNSQRACSDTNDRNRRSSAPSTVAVVVNRTPGAARRSPTAATLALPRNAPRSAPAAKAANTPVRKRCELRLARSRWMRETIDANVASAETKSPPNTSEQRQGDEQADAHGAELAPAARRPATSFQGDVGEQQPRRAEPGVGAGGTRREGVGRDAAQPHRRALGGERGEGDERRPARPTSSRCRVVESRRTKATAQSRADRASHGASAESGAGSDRASQAPAATNAIAQTVKFSPHGTARSSWSPRRPRARPSASRVSPSRVAGRQRERRSCGRAGTTPSRAGRRSRARS